jgi:hypothetical protein
MNPVGNAREAVELAGQDLVFRAFLTGVRFKYEDHGGGKEPAFPWKFKNLGDFSAKPA